MISSERGLIAYFARNPVAANLMMMIIIVMGLLTYFSIQRQMFATTEINFITIRAVYPGAAPQEMEESVMEKMEESLQDVTGIDKMVTRIGRGSGSISLEIDVGEDLSDVLDQVKLRIDSIATFPADMEPPIIYKREFTQPVLEIVLTGPDNPLVLKEFGKKIEDELLQLNDVTLVDFDSMPENEIAIEIAPETLRKYGLTLQGVTNTIRNYSSNRSAGTIETQSGVIAIRSEQQAYNRDDFYSIPVVTGAAGEQVLLGDIANIKDGFEERVHYMRFNGQEATIIAVQATSEQSMPEVSQSVRRYLEEKRKTLPAHYHMDVLVDMTYYLNGRLDMMLSNLAQGAVLVFIMLALFLRLKLALWVMVGLPLTFLGAIWLMPMVGVTINITSLFAFIMVLGIVVDDAIVIGESASTEIEKRGHSVDNVIRGAKRVAVPATFGVLTTIAVFAPFLFSEGVESGGFISIAGVVTLCLIFSLIESKLILPAHLAESKFKPIDPNGWRHRFNQRFHHFVDNKYAPFVEMCAKYRYLTLSTFVALLFITFSLMGAGIVRFIPMPSIPHDFPSITIEMNENVSEQTTLSAIKQIEGMINRVEQESIKEVGEPLVANVMAYAQSSTSGRIVVPLVDEEARPYDSFELARRWREQFPTIVGLKKITIQDEVIEAGEDGELSYRIYGKDLEELNEAGRLLMHKLGQVEGLFDIGSSIDIANKEIQLELKPVGYQLGLTPDAVARAVGLSFYGSEVQRVLREGDEIKVMVRYPRAVREQLSSLKQTRLYTPDGSEVMLGDVAELYEKPGLSYIRRDQGYRTVRVYASIDEAVITPGQVVQTVKKDIMPEVKKAHPSVKSELGGQVQKQREQQQEMLYFAVAGLLAVYFLLAIPLRSYTQPFIIMSVIPFGLTGAVWGHFFFGYDLSMMSIFGIIAAAGVVVNDSLVLTDFVNQLRREGQTTFDAVVNAGKARFRAILLTSLTTFFGLLPIMFETSLQARFVIPMAISLAFAVAFATLITLVLVPCLYMILDDIKQSFGKLRGQKSTTINVEAPAK
ncbi:efflux RND transporter permease subunit [Alteromonas sp. a30]|uniref:efflux RND transporter permease subunit n=1 Tax=Alteromonas sp. a30 TaxID=2730917 RepID=UPI0022810696|nr:efflux RND transporter permease subunit [Alteromonas sp. a30]MCY7296150.1 efflux RND transporter permease subunit [Alteromonas sp. a30]